MTGEAPLRTVLVLGAAYGGLRTSKLLAANLPKGWRVVVVDRNSHMNHIYVFPRFIAKSSLAPKGFIPYTNLFQLKTENLLDAPAGATERAAHVAKQRELAEASAESGSFAESSAPHKFVQGIVVGLTPSAATVLLPNAKGSYDDVADDGSDAPPERLAEIPFEYCVYALGAGLPAPCDVWGEYGRVQLPGRGTKTGGMAWMDKYGLQLRDAKRVVVIGGGALGIQYATDLKDLYPDHDVTLIHSRKRMLPRYPDEMHTAIVDGLARAGVEVILGERVKSWPPKADVLGDEKVVITEAGREVRADLVLLCTGETPHVSLMRGINPDIVSPVSGRIRVRPTMQVARRADESQMPVVPVALGVSGKVDTIVPNGVVPKENGTPQANGQTRANGVSGPNGVNGVDKAAEQISNLSLNGSSTPAPSTTLDHIFAVGDCAETPAIQAGHTAHWMGEVAAKNILNLAWGDKAPLEVYKPGMPAIKLTLGLKHYVSCLEGVVKTGDDGVDDLQARLMWPAVNAENLPDDA